MNSRIALAVPLALGLATASCTCGPDGYDPTKARKGRERERKGSAKDDDAEPAPKPKQHRLDLSGKPKRFGKGLKFAEGPAANRAGDLFFCGYKKDQILRVDHESGDVEVFIEDAGGAQGLMFDGKDQLYVAQEQERRIARIRKDKKVEVVADRWQGKQLNGPVDLVLDSTGGVYFSDPWFKGFKKNGEEQQIQVEGVYYVDANGTVTQVVKDLMKPTGVLLSLDEKTLYVSDYDDGSLMAYPIEDDRAKVGKGKVVSFDLQMPNGLALDTEGRVYVAAGGGVHLFDKDGKPDGTIATAIRIRNVAFGGTERNMLFMAAGNAVWRRELASTGATPHIPDLNEELTAKAAARSAGDGGTTGDDDKDKDKDKDKDEGDAKADGGEKKPDKDAKADDGKKKKKKSNADDDKQKKSPSKKKMPEPG